MNPYIAQKRTLKSFPKRVNTKFSIEILGTWNIWVFLVSSGVIE